MAGMGPAPKDPAKRARRNATPVTTMLPAGGRRGPCPGWPLPPDPRATAQLELTRARAVELRDQWAAAEDARTARTLAKRLETAELTVRTIELTLEQRYKQELSLWRDLWKLPQAVQWQRAGWRRDVAQYVRHKVLGELGDLDQSKEARQWSDRIGLTPLAMRRLGWTVAADEVAQRRDARTAAARATSARARRGPLRAVPASKAAGDE